MPNSPRTPLTARFPNSRVARPRRFRPTLEALDDRLVPAVIIGVLNVSRPLPFQVDVINGNMFIHGTAGNDSATIDYAGTGVRVTSGKISQVFPIVGSGAELKGFAGRDFLENNTGLRLTAYGGPGDDDIFGGYGADVIYGEEGEDNVVGREGPDTLYGGIGNDLMDVGFIGPNGPDSSDGNVMYGGPGNDTMFGSKGSDTMNGEEGNDVMLGLPGTDYMSGGPGNDTMVGATGTDYMSGGPGNDTMEGNDGEDYLFGDEGNDRMFAGGPYNGARDASYNYVNGGDGHDTMTGGLGFDYMAGYGGNDRILGNSGNDLIYAGSGHDTVSGGAGHDSLLGEDGNDVINAGTGNDFVDGGRGNDLVLGREGDDALFGGDNEDTIRGGTGNDFLSGSSAHFSEQTGNQAVWDGDGDSDKMYGEGGVNEVWLFDDRIYKQLDKFVDETNIDFSYFDFAWHEDLPPPYKSKYARAGHLFGQ